MAHPWSKGRRSGLWVHVFIYASVGPLAGLGWLVAIGLAATSARAPLIGLLVGLVILLTAAPPAAVAGFLMWPLRSRSRRYPLMAAGCAALTSLAYVGLVYPRLFEVDPTAPPVWFRALLVAILAAIGGVAAAFATRGPRGVEPVARIFE